MFQVNSNKAITVSISDNGGYVISYYEQTSQSPSFSFQMRILTASTDQEMLQHVQTAVNKVRASS